MEAISAIREEQRRQPSIAAGERHGDRAEARAVPASFDAGVGDSLPADGLPANEGIGSSIRTVSANRARDLRFVRRMHLLRTLGLGLGVLCIASVLRLHEQSLGWWILLVANGFVWPHAARLLAMHSAEPRRAEFRNLMADSALGGVWIAVMQFNLLPSVLLATMLSVDKVSVGGLSLLARTSALLVAGCVVTSAALGVPIDTATPMSVVIACMPFLVAYPLAISFATYSLASKLARQNRQLDELGRTDGLTRLANRRQGFASAETELARHRRTGRPAVLAILDVDRFKEINDRYGHPTGDDVLCAVADTLRGCCRAVDIVARYGGDEFLLVFSETDVRGAEIAAKRIRRQLDALTFENAPDLRCTVSVGAAEADQETTNVEAWIRRADAALYRAKDAGRDRFVGAAPLVLS
jgi:diguanylate cyclase